MAVHLVIRLSLPLVGTGSSNSISRRQYVVGPDWMYIEIVVSVISPVTEEACQDIIVRRNLVLVGCFGGVAHFMMTAPLFTTFWTMKRRRSVKLFLQRMTVAASLR